MPLALVRLLLACLLGPLCLPLASAAEQPAAATSEDDNDRLTAVSVSAQRYRPAANDAPGALGSLLGIGELRFGSNLWITLDRYVVTATRARVTPDRSVTATTVLDRAAIERTPAATVDSLLRSLPTFSLFRRSDSLTAHPTTQGVSLRGVGPSGASRSLVLLDGVPLNDPFGGWVAWNKIPRDALQRIEIVPGGGSSAWGNAALAGVVQAFLVPPATELMKIDRPPEPVRYAERGTVRASALLGDFGTRSGSLALSRVVGGGTIQVLAEDFVTDGFRIIAAERRGSIDIPAWNRHRSLALRSRHPLGSTTEISATLRGFEETRGNGTPFQRNATRETFASIGAAGQISDPLSWRAIAYAQDQTFASTFSSINATRTSETPASEQFAVPATALGVSFTAALLQGANGRTSGGVDVRKVRGETREQFQFSGGQFRQQRYAGGSQAIAGAFAVHERELTPKLQATVGARFDRWTESDGHRWEYPAAGASPVLTAYPDRDGAEFSPHAGLRWAPSPAWRIRAQAQQAFRLPTLNERYRPFRQGAVQTLANPALRSEQSTSGELDVEWMSSAGVTERASTDPLRPGARPRRSLRLGATLFWTDLRDGVTNVSLPPPTVNERQRLNVDRSRIRGAELTAQAMISPELTLSAHYLFNDARVRRSSVAPSLVGRRLAQVPRHGAVVGASWAAKKGLHITARLRWIGRQYENDENTLRLGEVVVADIGVVHPLTKRVELFANVENLGDARIETARTADGIVSTGTPRFAFGGVRLKW